MASRFSSRLDALGFSLPKWCTPPTEELVAGYEEEFNLKLPEDYRVFLVHHGGVTGNAVCAFEEPTPCGLSTIIDRFYGFTSPDRVDNVVSATRLIDGWPTVVAIGDNLLGAMFWLICTGPNANQVVMHDGEQRSLWSDELFQEMFPNLAEEIKEYLILRKNGRLPVKPKGYDHVYRLAPSFSEFIKRLKLPAPEQ